MERHLNELHQIEVDQIGHELDTLVRATSPSMIVFRSLTVVGTSSNVPSLKRMFAEYVTCPPVSVMTGNVQSKKLTA
ncbi:hypothetical protein D3H35_27515 [Cohnella faecalis]|uniref:Uncharacterized protein n=1 Tax=Cohnella faecalis TaxID=2315694 RepID=A0A398CLT8_9BACL|nr:hypothetical protein D3H35_27515 [Cohnella faecalis]